RTSVAQNVTVDEALSRLTADQRNTHNLPIVANAVIELLLQAELTTREAINKAVETTQETGMQMGRVLVYHKAVSLQIMKAVLTALILESEHQLTRAESINALKVVAKRRAYLEQILFEQGLHKEDPSKIAKIPELLTMSGLISESDNLECLEIRVLS